GGSAVHTLIPVADTLFPFVTDGAFLPDGRMVLRNYSSVSVLELPARPGGRLTEVAGARTPQEDQGESLAIVDGGRTLLLGSEGSREPVYRMPLPGPGTHSPATVVSGSATPDGETSAATSPPASGAAAAAARRESAAQVRSAGRLLAGVGGVMAFTGAVVGIGLMASGWSRRRRS